MDEPRIIGVDFDGTLAKTNFPEIIKPNKRIIRWVKRRKKKGWCIILNTCRHDKPLEEAVEWCKSQGLIFDYVNENAPWLIEKYGDTRKIAADIYIDDKNITIKNIFKTLF